MAIVVLGMHRSGTSCIAGMLEAAGVATAGASTVRSWDNARGHHERLDLVRLDEAVLAHSGGHWLAAPAAVRWTPAHERERDQLLATSIDGRPVLLKDPRMLLVLPFWRASAIAFDVIAVVRHPLAVARSLESWRELPLADGVALWLAHNRALAADRARHGYRVVDFDRPKPDVVRAVSEALGDRVGEAALAAGYDEPLVHHDDHDPPADVPGLREAIVLHHELVGGVHASRATGFPRAALAAFTAQLRAGDVAAAVASARTAIAAAGDTAAVLVPVVTALVRQRAIGEASGLVDACATRLDPGLAALLQGKLRLARGDAAGAIAVLEAACAVERPLFQARPLLAQALRGAGRIAEARDAIERAATEALYPHGPLATLAEWHWLDGEPEHALGAMARAIEAAPAHRRGRLRTRRAEWLIARGDREAARRELALAIDEDPGYARSREVLARRS
ncbi:MAG TPA: hypothetical protein VFQ53_06975 [Kofleriaceae bacterium]|nr:hypothetical protein [Kofleriaceae bacterium]